MKKILTASLAAVMAVASLGAASAASAQSHGARQDHRYEQRQDHRQVRPSQGQYARWQQAQHRYSAGRYAAPRGYSARQWAYGQRMPAAYRSNAYVVNDYNRYGLRAPPRGYQYVRSGNDVVLAAVAGGLITAVIAGLFN